MHYNIWDSIDPQDVYCEHGEAVMPAWRAYVVEIIQATSMEPSRRAYHLQLADLVKGHNCFALAHLLVKKGFADGDAMRAMAILLFSGGKDT